MLQTQRLRGKKQILKASNPKIPALKAKFTQRQKDNDNERVGEEKSEFDMQSKLVSQALDMIYEKSGRKGISLINQF